MQIQLALLCILCAHVGASKIFVVQSERVSTAKTSGNRRREREKIKKSDVSFYCYAQITILRLFSVARCSCGYLVCGVPSWYCHTHRRRMVHIGGERFYGHRNLRPFHRQAVRESADDYRPEPTLRQQFIEMPHIPRGR